MKGELTCAIKRSELRLSPKRDKQLAPKRGIWGPRSEKHSQKDARVACYFLLCLYWAEARRRSGRPATHVKRERKRERERQDDRSHLQRGTGRGDNPNPLLHCATRPTGAIFVTVLPLLAALRHCPYMSYLVTTLPSPHCATPLPGIVLFCRCPQYY